MPNKFKNLYSENKSLLLFLVLMTVFRSSLADWNDVPTGSMQPTIVEGDRIMINKVAYDFRVPFTHISLYKRSDPQRGDIIVFDSEASEIRLVKRVAAVPGDTVAMRNNKLEINGKQLEYHVVKSPSGSSIFEDRMEDLLGVKHKVRIRKSSSGISSFPAIKIPTGFYLALGDNRDNSADSRVIGLVPRSEIIGRTRSVVISLNYENHYIPRKERFLLEL